MSYGQVMADVECSPDERPMKTVKKPGFIKRWLYKIAEESWNNKRQEQERNAVNLVSSKQMRGLQTSAGAPSIDQPERAIQFTVYTASGGRVIETRRYDRKTDRSTNGLYVITSDQEFGREIDKIITMESLRQ